MKIKKFNENFNPYEKVYKVTFSGEIDVPLSRIKEMDKYYQYKGSDPDFAVLAALEQYFYERGDMHFDYKLYDGAGNPIEDEELFDKSIKYNL